MSKIFVTSDLHLGHANIIKYCKRPFTTVNEMDWFLVKNWNNTIRPHDKVYFLGDLSFQTEKWIPRLNGRITFIRGNHDRFKTTKYYDNFVLKYGGIYFYLTHRPENVPETWQGYAICGHHHNNNPDRYPFFNPKRKLFNVSVELTNYKPIDMNYIVKLTRS